MIHHKSVTKNSMYSLGSSLAQKLLTLVYFIVIARSFGPQEQGRYSAAIAYATLFSVFIELGVSSVLTRETARHPDKAGAYMSQTFLFRLFMSIVVYGAMIGGSFMLGYSSDLRSMIMIAGIASVIDTVTTSCWFLLRGFQNLFYESIGSLLAVIAMICAGLVFLHIHKPVSFLVFAVLLGSCTNFLFALWTLFFRAQVRVNLVPDWELIRLLIILALPFAGTAIFSRIYTFSDMTILTSLSGEKAAGWYAAGNKLLLALNIIPASLSASMYPAMSAYFISAYERLAHMLAKSLYYLFLFCMPLAVGIALLSKDIVLFFYGPSYLPSVRILHILSVTLVLSFLTYPIGSLLAATNKQHVQTVILGCAAALNIISNVVLIPSLNATGAALSALFTMLTILIAGGFAVRKTLFHSKMFLIKKAVLVIGASSVMGGGIELLRMVHIPFFINAIVAIGIYCVCALLIHALEYSDVRSLYHQLLHA